MRPIDGPGKENIMPRKKAKASAAVPEEAAAPVSGAEAAPGAPETVPEADSPAEPAPAAWPAEVRSPKGLNLREGPSLSYEVLEVLPDGAEVTALDLPKGAEVPGWRLVYTGERAGWVQRRFLRLRY